MGTMSSRCSATPMKALGAMATLGMDPADQRLGAHDAPVQMELGLVVQRELPRGQRGLQILGCARTLMAICICGSKKHSALRPCDLTWYMAMSLAERIDREACSARRGRGPDAGRAVVAEPGQQAAC